MTAIRRLRHRRLTPLLACLLVVGLVVACTAPEPVRRPLPRLGKPTVGKPYRIAGIWYHPKAEPYYDRAGIASWYGRKFHGRKTASGERFNMNALTAAHTTLPLPSLVRVTNLHNGRSIVLKVNDRGPFARGRIIDVSRRAADLLGFRKRGVARVRVQVVGRDGRPRARPPSRQVVRKPPPPRPAATREVEVSRLAAPATVETRAVRATELYVQAGAFIAFGNAARAADAIANVGPAAISRIETNGRVLYRVRIGPLATIEDADSVLRRVLASGNDDARIIVE